MSIIAFCICLQLDISNFFVLQDSSLTYLQSETIVYFFFKTLCSVLFALVLEI